MLNLRVAIDGIPVSLETRNDVKTLYDFLGTYLQLTSQPAAPLPENSLSVQKPISNPEKRKPLFGGQNPPPGERTIDYVTAVLEKHPEGLTPPQLLDKVRQAGWQTNSTDPLRLIRIGMYAKKEIFTRTASGKWLLTKFLKDEGEGEEGRDSLLPLAPEIPLADSGLFPKT